VCLLEYKLLQTFNHGYSVIVDEADLGSSNNKSTIHVLHVDDDPSFLEVSKLILSSQNNFDIENATSVNEALKKIELKTFDVVVSDYEMPLKDGLEFLRELRENKSEIPFVLFTGKGREEVAVKALNLGADGYIDKNGSPETVYFELAHTICKAVEGKHSRNLLAVTNSKYRVLVENSLQGIMIAQGIPPRVVYANAAMGKMMGYSLEEFTSLTPSEVVALVYKEDQAVFFNRFKDRLEGKQAENTYEFRAVRKDGLIVWMEAFATLIEYNGQPAVQSMFLNINERKRVEEACTKQSSLIDLSPDAIIVKNLDGTITFWNTGAEKLYGYTKEEATGQKIHTLLKPKLSELSDNIINELKQGKNWTGEITHYSKNNHEVLVQSYWSATIDSQGGLTEILESNVDITERKRAEDAIKFQADLLNHVGQAIIMVDRSRIIRFWNRAAEKLYGWSEEQALGHKVTELLGNTSPEEVEKVSKRLMSGENWSTEALAKNKNGSVVPVILNRTPMFNALGDYVGAASIATDITSQKNTEADLTFSLVSLSSSLNKIEVLNEKLCVLGGLTRHDVRNKLSTVTGYAYILKKKHSDQPDIVEGLGKMEQAVKEITKIFDFAKIYEQIGVEELSYIDVEDKLKEAVALFSGSMPTVINECRGLKVLADSFLRQLFYNFIDNTRKYGEKTTTITLFYEKADQDNIKLIYKDDGVGIALENKARLFSEGFSTGGSTGFGLFLIKKMIDVYGWQIQENGKPGEGAKFTITIPKTNKNGQENFLIM
jgi:PAS domain S-box-containing protein